jgi:hypothetical protein
MSDRLSIGEDALSGSEALWSEKPLVAIEQMVRARNLLDWKIEQAVVDARLARLYGGGDTEAPAASWADIGQALGVTRQVAWRKYAHTID